MMRYIWTYLCLWLCSAAIAQNSISVSIEQDSVLVGDYIDLNLTLQLDNPADVAAIDFSAWRQLPNLLYSAAPDFLDSLVQPSIIGDNAFGITDSYWSIPSEQIAELQQKGNPANIPLRISIYDMGYYQIPSPIIQSKSGKQYPSLESAKIFVSVPQRTAEQDSLEIMPIKDIIAEGTTWEDYKIWLYILGLALLAWLSFVFFPRRKEEEQEIAPEPEVIIPAHIKALDALGVLDKQQLWQKGNVKAYQSGLTDIIRQYLEDRFDINALEMTTDEISRALKHKDFDSKHTSTLERILQMADLVKFAKAKPTEDIHTEFMQEAVSFVEQTKKVDMPADE